MGILAQVAAPLPLRLGCPTRLVDEAPPPFASLGAGADPRKGGRGRKKGNPPCPSSLPSNNPRAQQHHDLGLKVPVDQALGDVDERTSVNGDAAGAAKPALALPSQRRRAPYDVGDEAWGLLRESVVRYCGSPVGTIAACDPNDSRPLNYDQVFIRDFVPSGVAFLLKGKYDLVRNFILHTLQLQSWEKTMDCHSPGQGLMPASFKVRAIPLEGDDDAIEEVLDPDFGEAAIGRVAPVDSDLSREEVPSRNSMEESKEREDSIPNIKFMHNREDTSSQGDYSKHQIHAQSIKPLLVNGII